MEEGSTARNLDSLTAGEGQRAAAVSSRAAGDAGKSLGGRRHRPWTLRLCQPARCLQSSDPLAKASPENRTQEDVLRKFPQRRHPSDVVTALQRVNELTTFPPDQGFDSFQCAPEFSNFLCEVSTVHFNCVLSACARKRQWAPALMLLTEMEEIQVPNWPFSACP